MITRHQISLSLSLNLVLPMYHGTIGISQNHRLFRFATVSWHYQHSLIAVYFGLPEYHGIISLQIAVYFSLPMYYGIIGISISPFISVLPKYHGIGIHLILSDISSLSHMTVRLSIMVTQLFLFPKLHFIVSCSVNRTIPSSHLYLVR